MIDAQRAVKELELGAQTGMYVRQRPRFTAL